MVRIASDGVRDVVFSVPEDKVTSFQPGMPVKVRGWAQDAYLSGAVREVGASADPATRTYQIKVALSLQDTAPPLGSTVYVLPEGLGGGGTEGLQVIKLPTSALRRDGNTSAVWVLDKTSMTVKSQTVQIATADGNDAVIAAGLQPGMLVVSAGVHVLSPGQKVTVYQEKTALRLLNQAQTAINSGANDAAAVKLANPALVSSAPTAPLVVTPAAK